MNHKQRQIASELTAILRRIERQEARRNIIILPGAPSSKPPRPRQQRMWFVLPQVVEAIMIITLPECVTLVFDRVNIPRRHGVRIGPVGGIEAFAPRHLLVHVYRKK